jgi:hypothetical protein
LNRSCNSIATVLDHTSHIDHEHSRDQDQQKASEMKDRASWSLLDDDRCRRYSYKNSRNRDDKADGSEKIEHDDPRSNKEMNVIEQGFRKYLILPIVSRMHQKHDQTWISV